MPKTPRVNKTKAQIIAEQEQEQRISRMVSLAKLMWPFIENQETIYDAQTALFGISGYIETAIQIREDELKVSDLKVDLTKEVDGKIKTSMVNLLGLLEIENARDAATLTKKMADMIGQFGANEFVKGPMSNIKVSDIVK